MRVLQIHTRYRQSGGEDSVVAVEGALLREAGHLVVEHAAVNPEDTLGASWSLARAVWNPAAARSVGALVDRVHPDIAHVHNTWFATSPSVIAALSRRGVPIVMTLHNYRLLCANAQLTRDGRICHDCVGGSSIHGVVHRCYRDSRSASAVAALTVGTHRLLHTWTKGVDRFIALTNFGRDLFVQGGFPSEKIVVRNNFTGDPGPRRAPPSASRTVLIVGRLSTEKGVEVALDAWRSASPPGLELTIIGDGPLLESLRNPAIDGVTFHGRLPREQVIAHLLSARALLFPSTWYEGMPMTLLEAMSAGLPVISSDLGPIAELTAPGGWGTLAAARDRGAWEVALSGLSDGASVDAAGEAGRRRFLASFTRERGLSSLEEIYRQVIAAHRES